MTVCEIFFKLKFSKFKLNIRTLIVFGKFILIVYDTKKFGGGCHHLLLVYDASKLSIKITSSRPCSFPNASLRLLQRQQKRWNVNFQSQFAWSNCFKSFSFLNIKIDKTNFIIAINHLTQCLSKKNIQLKQAFCWFGSNHRAGNDYEKPRSCHCSQIPNKRVYLLNYCNV